MFLVEMFFFGRVFQLVCHA